MENLNKVQSNNFLLSIYQQDNFSYQGEIHWLDTGKKLRFRSERELMNLIHEATNLVSNECNLLRTWNDDKTMKAM